MTQTTQEENETVIEQLPISSNHIDTLKWHRFYNEQGPVGYEMFDFEKPEGVAAQVKRVMNNVPNLIRAATSAATATNATTKISVIEGLITLYTASVMAGSLGPNCWVNYDNKKNYLALMLLIVYPPASGKGVASQTRKLLSKINQELFEQYNEGLSFYKEEMRNYRKVKTGMLPEKPKLKPILAPGNTSSAKLVEMLSDLQGTEILTLFESELDAIGLSSDSEFGKMNTTIFRQAFHHEPISKMIKTDDEILIANVPKLSIIICGTQNQVNTLLHSNGDGLVSRFMVLTGDVELEWKNTQPCEECVLMDDHFEKVAEEYYQAWRYLKAKAIEVKFTQEQWDALQSFGSYYMHKSHHFSGESASSIAKRHALMVCRLAGIFTMLRVYEQKINCMEATCSDTDFGNALWMMEYSLHCALKLFATLPGEKGELIRASNKISFLKLLPETFSSEDVSKVIKDLSISERTVSRWLSQFVEAGYLYRIKPGYYEKRPMAAVAMAAVTTKNSKI